MLTGTPFNLMAQIGMLILIGIVVNNGIVLVHHVHQLRERGVERTQALLKAARDRLRPILMTTRPPCSACCRSRSAARTSATCCTSRSPAP